MNPPAPYRDEAEVEATLRILDRARTIENELAAKDAEIERLQGESDYLRDLLQRERKNSTRLFKQLHKALLTLDEFRTKLPILNLDPSDGEG
jgi:chromosome segregation ATPase